jgi:hypothetical protein
MVRLVKDFVNHLFDIVRYFVNYEGLVGMKTVQEFVTIYQKNAPSDETAANELKEILAKTLVEYISNLSQGNIITMSNDIIAKFIESSCNQRTKGARVLFHCYSKVRGWHNKANVNSKFQKWKKTTMFDVLKHPSYILSRTHSKSHLVSDSRSGSISQCSKCPVGETLEDKKHKDDLMNCTFTPKINNYELTSMNRNPNTFDRLYTDHEMYKHKQGARSQARGEREGKQMSFSPDMSLTQHKNTQNDGFHERQQKYYENKKNRKAHLRTELDSSTNSECTFRPKINNTSMEMPKERYNSPGYMRLYNISVSRQKSNKSRQEKDSTRQVDYKRLEELYNDYKKHSYNKTKLKDSINEENGVTFKPHLNSHLPASGLIERNYKMLEDKKNFVENYYKRDDGEPKKATSGKNINRLYEKGVEKMRERNQISKTIVKGEKLATFTFYDGGTLSPKTEQRKYDRDSKYDSEQQPADTVVFNPTEEDNRPRKFAATDKRHKPSFDKELPKQTSYKNYSTLRCQDK